MITSKVGALIIRIGFLGYSILYYKNSKDYPPQKKKNKKALVYIQAPMVSFLRVPHYSDTTMHP